MTTEATSAPKVRHNLAVGLPLRVENQHEPLSTAVGMDGTQRIQRVRRRKNHRRHRLALPCAHAVALIQPPRFQPALHHTRTRVHNWKSQLGEVHRDMPIGSSVYATDLHHQMSGQSTSFSQGALRYRKCPFRFFLFECAEQVCCQQHNIFMVSFAIQKTVGVSFQSIYTSWTN